MKISTPWLWSLGSAFAVTLCGSETVEQRPNVLWIVSEDNGPELGCYGDPRARTPHLDRLAAEGVRFTHAFVPYAVCSPSRASFLTGLHPQQHGQLGLATHRFALYREDTPNIVTRLRAAGYRSGLVGKLHVSPESAFPFDYRAVAASNFSRVQPAEAYVDAAVKFWRDAGDRPWFLTVNFPDAHLPFVREAQGRPAVPQTGGDVKPLPWIGADSARLRDITADYYNCLARLDDGVGRLLAALDQSGAAANTIVVYFGDHGAQFPRGKGTVYDAALRVPLIIRWPGRTVAGTVRAELVSTIDLLPTVLRAAGLPVRGLPGRELQPLFGTEPPASWREYVHAVTTGSLPQACFVQESIQDRRWKLIWSPSQPPENNYARGYLGTLAAPPHYPTGLVAEEIAALPAEVKAAYDRWISPPRYELYDLQTDPQEWRNLADDPAFAPIKARLIAALEAHQLEIGDPFLEPGNVDAYVREQIAHRGSDYLRDKGFRWSHADLFRKWREQRTP